MILLYVLNALVLPAAAWALWVRRDTVHSRWDGPITAGIGLFALGALLDSPWPQAAAASLAPTGKAYLLNSAGHICYLLGATRGLKTVAVRLMPDHAIGPFIRRRIMPPTVVASLAMVFFVVASPATSTMSAANLYFVPADGWLVAYWATYFLTLTGLNAVALYGSFRLRSNGRSSTHDLLVAATAAGTLACWGFFAAIVAGQHRLIETVVWPGSQLAIIAGAVACGISWRHRVAALTGRITP